MTGTAGAGTFKDEWAPKFKDKQVWITYDCDEEGRKGAQRAALALKGHAKKVRVADLALPDDGADVTDWFVRYGRTLKDFKALLAKAPLAKAGPAAVHPPRLHVLKGHAMPPTITYEQMMERLQKQGADSSYGELRTVILWLKAELDDVKVRLAAGGH